MDHFSSLSKSFVCLLELFVHLYEELRKADSVLTAYILVFHIVFLGVFDIICLILGYKMFFHKNNEFSFTISCKLVTEINKSVFLRLAVRFLYDVERLNLTG